MNKMFYLTSNITADIYLQVIEKDILNSPEIEIILKTRFSSSLLLFLNLVNANLHFLCPKILICSPDGKTLGEM